MGSRNAKPPPPGPGRPHGLLAPYTWPGSGEVLTIGKAVPRQMRTVGCTWDEATAFIGLSRRTVDSWLVEAARVHRGLAAGRNPADLTEHEHALADFLVDVNQAAAEVVALWQGILEREGRGGFPITRTTVVERRSAPTRDNPDGDLIEKRTETVTENARPDTKVIMWKMTKQLRRYRERPPVVLVGGDGVEIPEPDDATVAGEVAESLRAFQAARALPRARVLGNGNGDHKPPP